MLSSVGSEGFFRLQRGLRWRSLIRVIVAEEEGSHRCRMLQTERRTNERESEKALCAECIDREVCFLIAFGGSLLKPTKGGLPQALVGKVPEHLVDQIWRSKKTGRLDLRRSGNNVMTATCRRRLARSRVLLKVESQLPIDRHPSHPCCKERGSRLLLLYSDRRSPSETLLLQSPKFIAQTEEGDERRRERVVFLLF